MANLDNWGSVSNGLDRAQLHVGPPGKEADDPRPPLETLSYRKPSIRKAVKDNLLSAIVHPRHGVNKIKAAIAEKHEASSSQPHPHHEDHAPMLAPPPGLGTIAGDRLDDDFKEKPHFPPAKEFLHNPVAAIISTVQDQRGSDAAESLLKLEISHGADVQLLKQSEKIEEASDESDREAEYKTFVEMKSLRQDVFVRWTVDRHVRIIARKIGNFKDAPPKRPKLFWKGDDEEKAPTWSQYVPHVGTGSQLDGQLLTMSSASGARA